MTYSVRFGETAEEDLLRLLAHLVERAATLAELGSADAAVEAVHSAASSQLSTSPYSCRKIGPSPTRRELIIPFGSTGYVALFEIESETSVVVLAVRHQREEDYH